VLYNTAVYSEAVVDFNAVVLA